MYFIFWRETQKIKRSFLVNHFFDLNTDQTLSIAYGNMTKKENSAVIFCSVVTSRLFLTFLLKKVWSSRTHKKFSKITLLFSVTTTGVTLYENIQTNKKSQIGNCLHKATTWNSIPRQREIWQNQSLPIRIFCIQSMQQSKIIKTNYECDYDLVPVDSVHLWYVWFRLWLERCRLLVMTVLD